MALLDELKPKPEPNRRVRQSDVAPALFKDGAVKQRR
jgi:hypothetical protein